MACVIKEPKTKAVLKERFKAHIEADLKFSHEHAEQETRVGRMMVDVADCCPEEPTGGSARNASRCYPARQCG